MSCHLIKQLLWPFKNLPSSYVVMDTETTGLYDKNGAPGIISIGVVIVQTGSIINSEEYKLRPHRPMTNGAQKIHGISHQQAMQHPSFISQWPAIKRHLNNQLLIFHNAWFDWLLLIDHIERYQVSAAESLGVFCSQRAAQAWAQAVGLICSERGPSLDILTQTLQIDNLRANHNGLHGALIDAKQTALVVEALRQQAND